MLFDSTSPLIVLKIWLTSLFSVRSFRFPLPARLRLAPYDNERREDQAQCRPPQHDKSYCVKWREKSQSLGAAKNLDDLKNARLRGSGVGIEMRQEPMTASDYKSKERVRLTKEKFDIL